jgi:hypothetical protein
MTGTPLEKAVTDTTEDWNDLYEAIEELFEYEYIDNPVRSIAQKMRSKLLGVVPCPKVFCHGPDSVVFNWEKGNENLYLTVSSTDASIVYSTPTDIEHEEYKLKGLK